MRVSLVIYILFEGEILSESRDLFNQAIQKCPGQAGERGNIVDLDGLNLNDKLCKITQ